MVITADFRSAEGGSIPLALISCKLPGGQAVRRQTLTQQTLVRTQAGQLVNNWRVAACGRQSVLKTDMPGESLRVQLLCPPP